MLTTTDGVDGAACIAYDGMPERIRRRLGVDFYVLPSSVHEVIILPDDKSADVQALNRMVEEINSSVVAEMDVLSNRVYHFPEDMF